MNAQELIEQYLVEFNIERLLFKIVKEYKGTIDSSFGGRGYDLEFYHYDDALAAWERLYWELEGTRYHVQKRKPDRMPGGMYWFGVYK